MFIPRRRQKEVLAYHNGMMGVSAVPGSGKTHTLSALAAELIARGQLADDGVGKDNSEVLVVTLVNSAVDNFSQRIGIFIQERGLLPFLGYRVRTLHGLAHDIVRERPALVGLSDDFQIIDERAADKIRAEAVQTWLRNHPAGLDDYFEPGIETNQRDWIRREKLPELVENFALNYIRSAKDMELTPSQIKERLDHLPVPLPLAEMGWVIYADYQRALVYRGAVDFDDLIRLALQALQQDDHYLERLRERWPYILEDEAQDSSRLQEKILRLLVGTQGNWVRVGDPNQAIYETFTTASPEYLRKFLVEHGVTRRVLPNSGRSTRSIIDLANHLVDWTHSQHPWPEARLALTKPHILPTKRGDPQPNPRDDPAQVHLISTQYTPQEEVQAVVESLVGWLPEHREATVAVLVPRNKRGYDLVTELKRRKLDFVEILRSTSATRTTAGVLGNIIKYLSDPQSASKLAVVYRVWRRAAWLQDDCRSCLEKVADLLRKCQRIEDYLWPHTANDWIESLADLSGLEDGASIRDELVLFREKVQGWQGTTSLPVDQIVLTLAQDLFTEPTDLAISHKLAVILRQASQAHMDWRLPEMTEELAVVARNERRFLGFSEDDSGFDPDRHRGKVVVATIHKAKGLEWDRVYLMSVNNYDFPSGMPNDRYISEKVFIRDHLNLEAEGLAQLDATASKDEYTWYEEGRWSQKVRLEYVCERLRLLYVGITRARKELVITWNTGRDGKQLPALPFVDLQSYWEQKLTERT